MLEYLYNEGCHYEENCCMRACSSGHLEVLKWLRERDFPWDKDCITYGIEEGKNECVIWAIENGCPIPEHAIEVSVISNNLDMLIYLHEVRGLPLLYRTYYHDAIYEIIEYMHIKKCPGSCDSECYICDKLEETLIDLWEIEELEYNNYIQWLPREVLDEVILLVRV